MQVDIVGNEEIQVTIAIVVQKGASRSPASIAFIDQPGLLGNIGKCAISIVAVKNILTVISDEDILKAVVVIVPDGYSTGPSGTYQPSLLRDIGKRSVPIIFVEAITRIWNGRVHARAAQYKDIQPSVVVIVQEGDTATHRLNDVVLMLESAVDDWERSARPGQQHQ